MAGGKRLAGSFEHRRFAHARAKLPGRDFFVGLAHQGGDMPPRDASIEHDSQPAARPDIGRHEEMCRLRMHMSFLRAGRCVEPQGDAAVAVVIDGVSREGLAANPEIG